MTKQKMTVHYDGKPLYDITLADNYDGLEEVLQNFALQSHKICIVTDDTVGAHYAEKVKTIAQKAAAYVCVFSFPAGESSKTLDVIEDLYEVLIKAHFDRKDFISHRQFI